MRSVFIRILGLVSDLQHRGTYTDAEKIRTREEEDGAEGERGME